MCPYSDGSRSWCSAAPTVRMSANTSKPSNVHPRFDAINAFHCVQLSDRYHGEVSSAPNSPMLPSLSSHRQRVEIALGSYRRSKSYQNKALLRCDGASPGSSFAFECLE